MARTHSNKPIDIDVGQSCQKLSVFVAIDDLAHQIVAASLVRRIQQPVPKDAPDNDRRHG